MNQPPVTSKRRKRILYLCHVDWGWIKQRPQHLAEQLRRFFDVTVAFHCRWKRKGLPNRFVFSQSCIPLLHLPFRGRFPIVATIDYLLTRLMLRLILWFSRPDYVWLTWPEFIQFLPRKMKAELIYDCMDDAQAFPSEANRTSRLQQAEQELVARAKVIFISSERLGRVLASRHAPGKKLHLLRNAYDGQLLSTSDCDHRGNGPFKIGYCGTIAEWLDWEMLLKLVESNPQVEVNLVGPLDQGVTLRTHSRIVWHGPVEHSALPAIMAKYDCLAMPFKRTPLIESVDPVKLYEYINFGKPILSVFYDEIARFEPYVHFYCSHDQAIEIVADLAKGKLGRKYSTRDREAFLLENTWAQRAETGVLLLDPAAEEL